MLRRTSLLLLLSAYGHLCIQAQDARVVTRIVTDTMPAWKTWASGTGTMNYPEAWTMTAPSKGDTLVIFRKPVDASPATQPQLSVISTLAKTVPSEKEVSSDLQGKNMEVIAVTSTDGSGGYLVEYMAEIEGVSIHHLKQVIIQGDQASVLTYSAKPKAYEENRFLAEAMMNSFSAAGDR